jgi:hypothetical protein
MAKGDFSLTVPQMKKAAELYGSGFSRRQIGDYFGVSDTAAGNALRFMGVTFRDRAEAATLGLQHWKKARRRVASVCDLAKTARPMNQPISA